ncbi:MAG: hypothetical protein HC890_13750 [Chloroflexaceae bacterium]|nr:hypothetical protein [Chloroflexaceae bacterium]
MVNKQQQLQKRLGELLIENHLISPMIREDVAGAVLASQWLLGYWLGFIPYY